MTVDGSIGPTGGGATTLAALTALGGGRGGRPFPIGTGVGCGPCCASRNHQCIKLFGRQAGVEVLWHDPRHTGCVGTFACDRRWVPESIAEYRDSALMSGTRSAAVRPMRFGLAPPL